MAPLNKCCCCCSLRTGTLVLSVIALLGYLFGVFGAVWSLVIHDQYVVRIINMMAAFNPSLLDDDASSSEDSDNATATFQDLYETYVPVATGVLVGTLVFNLIGAACGLCALIGIIKKRPLLLMPWLVLAMLSMLVMAVLIIVGMFYLALMVSVTLLISGLVGLSLSLYFWMVVYSYYKNLREQERLELDTPVEMKTRLTAGM